MEAKLKKQGEISIVMIQGHLNIEETQSFRDVCVKHFTGQKVIFNMEKANFVGSTGLQPFLETIQHITQDNANGLKIVGVKSEFRRIFQNMDAQNLEIHDTEAGAIASFNKIVNII